MLDTQGPGRARQWPRLLGELIVVAAGVFLGLAAGAAWDARQDPVLEAEEVESGGLQVPVSLPGFGVEAQTAPAFWLTGRADPLPEESDVAALGSG